MEAPRLRTSLRKVLSHSWGLASVLCVQQQIYVSAPITLRCDYESPPPMLPLVRDGIFNVQTHFKLLQCVSNTKRTLAKNTGISLYQSIIPRVQYSGANPQIETLAGGLRDGTNGGWYSTSYIWVLPKATYLAIPREEYNGIEVQRKSYKQT